MKFCKYWSVEDRSNKGRYICPYRQRAESEATIADKYGRKLIYFPTPYSYCPEDCMKDKDGYNICYRLDD